MNPDSTQPDERRENRATRRKVQTRARLLDAGRAVITQKGVDAATIGEIAEATDLGLGSFYI